MIRHWLTRYHLRYPRSLAYMLQASEYNITDYIDWYRNTENFSQVEIRKSFVKSAKSNVVLVSIWLTMFCLYLLAVSFIWLISKPLNYFAVAIFVFLAPFILPYLLIIPMVVIKLFQYPVEWQILKKAKQKISFHRGLKIAIAGSFGKTSMREILKTVLSQGKRVAAAPHSYNTPLGISKFIETLDGSEDIVIFELGEYYPGDIDKLCKIIHPDIGVITGINEAHLKKFKTLERTIETIFELSKYVSPQKLYVNAESELAGKRAAGEYIKYNRAGVKDWKVTKPVTGLDGTSFFLENGSNAIQLHSSLLGLHQVGPLALGVEIATQAGLTLSQAQEGIAKTVPFEHRLQPSKDVSDVVTLDDSYNGNPDGVTAVIEFLSTLKDRRRFYVTPGLVEMGSKTRQIHQLIGKKLAEAGIEKVVLIKNSVTPFIGQGLRESHYRGEVLWFDDSLSAFSALPSLTVKGDVVLLQNDWSDQYR